jgi:hypothetical protein
MASVDPPGVDFKKHAGEGCASIGQVPRQAAAATCIACSWRSTSSRRTGSLHMGSGSYRHASLCGRRSSPGSSISSARASRIRVETRGSRLPASILLTSVAWTPLRSATSSWVRPSCRRAAEVGPEIAHRRIVRVDARCFHRIFHKRRACAPWSGCGRVRLPQRTSGPAPAERSGRLGDPVHHLNRRNFHDLHSLSPPPPSSPRRESPGGG